MSRNPIALPCRHLSTKVAVFMHATCDLKVKNNDSNNIQVLELWEDTSESAASLPLEARHYVRALFNGEELTVRTPVRTVNSEPGASGDGSRSLPKLLTLKEFKAEILDVYAKTSADYSSSCAQGSGFWQFLKSISGGKGTKEDTSKY